MNRQTSINRGFLYSCYRYQALVLSSLQTYLSTYICRHQRLPFHILIHSTASPSTSASAATGSITGVVAVGLVAVLLVAIVAFRIRSTKAKKSPEVEEDSSEMRELDAWEGRDSVDGTLVTVPQGDKLSTEA